MKVRPTLSLLLAWAAGWSLRTQAASPAHPGPKIQLSWKRRYCCQTPSSRSPWWGRRAREIQNFSLLPCPPVWSSCIPSILFYWLTIKPTISKKHYLSTQIMDKSHSIRFPCLKLLFWWCRWSSFFAIFKLGHSARLQQQLEARMSRRNRREAYSDEEAEEVREEIEQESGPMAQSEEEGEDLLESAERDYQPMDELDHYERESVDQEHFDLNPEARRLADKQLNRRDKNEREVDEDLQEYIEEDYAEEVRRKRAYYEQQDEETDEEEEEMFIDPEECKGRLHEWIGLEKTKKFIKRRFIRFLKEFCLNGVDRIYYHKWQLMLHENRQSLDISYDHFKEANPILALWLGLEPAHLIPELNAVLYSFLSRHSPAFKSIVQEVYVKFYGMPVHDRIRELRVEHIGKLVNIKGVVTVRGEVLNQLKKTFFKCYRCGELKGPYYVADRTQINLGNCRSCQSTGPFMLDKTQCVYRNHQKITVQESHADVDAGRIPRTKEVVLMGDNVDVLKPGEEAQITGIFMQRYECAMNVRQGYPVFSTYVEANSIVRISEVSHFSNVEESQFHQFAKKHNLAQIVYDSIAPSVYGHMEVKQAIAFALFGGTEKFDEKNMHRTRGDINVLLLGDPGIAKSQFLKSIQKISDRCVYATGKGASAVGLTASVKQDLQTGEWKLEAGAMVQADRGICLIDEFDKMNDHDRTSIHEAMEQQTISISKAGIVTQLRARCSVIAAANPLQGRYNETLNFSDNVSLSDPILSRFDLIKVMKDKPNEQVDRNLSTFVINLHMENHPYNKEFSEEVPKLISSERPHEVAEPEFLKHYIKYVRNKFKNTRINEKCSEIIKDFYTRIRKVSFESGGIVITPRHLESMIRICEAHAKMHLRQEPIREDGEVAIRVMLRSFIETQKHGPGVKIGKEFQSFL